MTFKEYRNKYQYKLKDDIFIGYFVSVPFSYLLNKLFYNERLVPNKISFWMLLSGLFGGALFCIPVLWIQMLGFIFIHLWFTFDCWDGAVARQTKKFSNYGKEFDYFVHIIVHPVILGSFMLNLDGYNFTLTLVYLVLNVMKRGLYFLEFSRNHAEAKSRPEVSYNLKYLILDFFSNAPNFLLIAPFFIMISANLVYEFFIIPFILFELLRIFLVTRGYLRIYLQ